jgi:2TM domain
MMNTPLSDQDIERMARKRAGAKIGWFIHATVFVLVNLFIFSISEYGLGNRAWSIKPLLGWGLGLTLHGIAVWFLGTGGEVRERMIDRERARLKRKQNDL